MKSTSGGVAKLGRHAVESWSATQAVIATSSGEAEYYGMVKWGFTGICDERDDAGHGNGGQLEIGKWFLSSSRYTS